MIPSPQAWREIVRDAEFFRLRGENADAAIVLRRGDALALAAAAFGETGAVPERDLSAIERDVLARTVAALAPSLAAVCGGSGERGALERVATIAGFVTYFELVVEGPVGARIGIALSRDPAPERSGRLEPADLAGVVLAPRVTLSLGAVEARIAAGLSIGTVLPIPRTAGFRGSLRLAGRTLARGTCGVVDGYYALSISNGAHIST